MTIIDWTTLFKTYGWIGVMVVALAYIAFQKPQYFKTVINVFHNSAVISETQLTNHVVFSQLDFWIIKKVPTFNFKSKFRNLVFRDYLTIYLKTYKYRIEEFVNDKKYEDLDNNEFWNTLAELFNSISKEYEAEMSDSGIPLLVIEKMKTYDSNSVELMMKLIKGVSQSEFYKSEKNQLKIYSALNIICPIIENVILHSEEVCTVLNGELTGMTYKNETEIKLSH